MCAPRSARRRQVLNSGAEPHEPGSPEHDKVHRGTHLPFTSRDRRGDDPQCAAAIVVPRAGGLRHHGKKANSLVSRKSGSVLVIAFHLCVRSRRADRNLRSLVQGLRPLKASNGKVKRSRSPIQAWQVDVRRTSASHLFSEWVRGWGGGASNIGLRLHTDLMLVLRICFVPRYPEVSKSRVFIFFGDLLYVDFLLIKFTLA